MKYDLDSPTNIFDKWSFVTPTQISFPLRPFGSKSVLDSSFAYSIIPDLHFRAEIATFGLGLLELLIRVSWVQRREIVDIANPHGLDCAPEVFQTRMDRLTTI